MTTHAAIVAHWVSKGWDVDADACWACGYVGPVERCHVIPACRGGKATPANLMLLCAQCHHEAPSVLDDHALPEWVRERRSCHYAGFPLKVFCDEPMQAILQRAGTRPESEALDLLRASLRKCEHHHGRLSPATVRWAILDAFGSPA